MFKKILIANRGEIACRVIKTAREMGIQTVAVYSDADKQALHVQMADEAVHIGGSPASESYLVADKIIAACKETGAEGVHPGYGFLSENAGFCEALGKAGVTFIGPPVGAIEAMGDKITSKKIAADANVSTVPGYMGLIADAAEAVKISNEIGYPVMIKASAGGGGKGMRIAWNDAEAREGFERSKSEAASSFGDDRIFIEKFVTNPRHIEIQVLCDSHGNGVYLGERECSIQRRNQKVIEEAPSPFLDEATRKAMGEQAVALAKAVGYTSAGTVEFIVDGDKNFYFLEMNTRLQVEHPVTELITGLDLVEQMLRVASGEKLTIKQSDITLNGWAIESRLYAEDPYRNFLPSVGRLTRYQPPQGDEDDEVIVRNDTGVYEGGEISTFYDPMIAKLCTWAPTRDRAIAAMARALDQFEVEGVGHNLPFLSAVMRQDRFKEGRLTTGYIAEEFPDGFTGADLSEDERMKIAVAAVALRYMDEIDRRAAQGQKNGELDGGGLVADLSRRSALIGEDRFDIHLSGPAPDTPSSASVTQPGSDEVIEVSFGMPYEKSDRIAYAFFDNDQSLIMKIDRRTMGFRVRTLGADLNVDVLRPHVADLMALMPVKLAPDMSQFLLCPMPGQVVRLDVNEGDVVEEGQTLAVVEAMKMENVLKAEKRAKVLLIKAVVGSVLAVDDVIMEFEDV
ncbi:MAG: acetyl/propionyl/methylcrotonyl-CoA carboxylase subunit alpha [Hyphomicrobiaceae bacterium]|nr:acetyl/propionyl/methylcrotonyl-CoA carboxylase subunit alpha [Hyphomicrobiaceae bacterium]